MQQYKFKRNFPFNNTIKEESAEHLSENRSVNTFNSGFVNQNIHTMQRMINAESEYLNFKKEFVNMKSDHFIPKYANEKISSEGTSPYQTQEFKAYSQRYVDSKISPMSINSEYFKVEEVNLLAKLIKREEILKIK